MYYNSSITAMVIVAAVTSLLSIGARVLFMLAVGSDAKGRGTAKRGAWMALTFFFPYAAIVYACVRKSLPKSVPQLCNKCGATVMTGVECPTCGSGDLLPITAKTPEQQKKTTKGLLIGAAVAYCLSAVLVVVGNILSFATVLSSGLDDLEDFFDGGYSYYDDYDLYDYDDFFDRYDDYDDDYDYDWDYDWDYDDDGWDYDYGYDNYG